MNTLPHPDDPALFARTLIHVGKMLRSKEEIAEDEARERRKKNFMDRANAALREQRAVSLWNNHFRRTAKP